MLQEKKAYEIVSRLCQAGFEAYIAGGAARDILRGKRPNDYDVVTNASYETVKELFKSSKISVVGVSFKVCIVEGIEVATYRKTHWENVGTDGSAAPQEAETAETLEEDLARRDLTINAMAFCPYNGDVVDLYGGQNDLKNRVIRFTGSPDKRIEEDPCRLLRACRFKALLEASFSSETVDAMKRNRHLANSIAPERIRLELMKALSVRKPSIFFFALYDIGLLGIVSPGFETCFGHDGGKYHGETIDEHVKITGDFLPVKKPLLRLAGYFHDHGKPVTAEKKEDTVSFIGHDKKGAELVSTELEALRFSVRDNHYVTSLIKHHMRSVTESDKPKTVRRLLKKLADDNVNWKDWLLLKLADTRANLKKEPKSRKEIKGMVLKIYRELNPPSGNAVLSIKDLAISGADVMHLTNSKQGPEIGRILKLLLEAVLDDPSKNNPRDLRAMVEGFNKGK